MPKLSFIYAYPLDVGRRRIFKEKGFGEYPSIDEVKQTFRHWKSLWEELNKDNRIITSLVDITKRTPVRALECFVFGAGLNPMSTPFLMPVMGRGNSVRSDESFTQTLIHELLHIFLSTDNQNYWEFVREKYAKEDILVQNHILIYAMLHELYAQLFEQVPPDFTKDELPEGYMRAVEIVKEFGAKTLIEEYYDFACKSS
jgi:hypothetical protein